jgi:hypothetical protein
MNDFPYLNDWDFPTTRSPMDRTIAGPDVHQVSGTGGSGTTYTGGMGVAYPSGNQAGGVQADEAAPMSPAHLIDDEESRLYPQPTPAQVSRLKSLERVSLTTECTGPTALVALCSARSHHPSGNELLQGGNKRHPGCFRSHSL